MAYWFAAPIPWFSNGRAHFARAPRLIFGDSSARQSISCSVGCRIARYRGQTRFQRSKAASMHSTKAGPCRGLVRKQTAPAESARARTMSSGSAVMTITGMKIFSASRRLCRARPSRRGIWASIKAQDVSCNRGELRNSAADANECACQPSDRTSRAIARRADGSSSTIDMR